MKLIYIGLGLVVIALIIAGVVYYASLQSQNQSQGSPNLAFSLSTNIGKAGDNIPLTLNIENTDSDAKKVAITLSSDALGQVPFNTIDIQAGKTGQVQQSSTIADVSNGNHDVTIAYSINGGQTKSTHESFYVLPKVHVAELQWPNPGLTEKSHIKQTDSTTLKFKIQNDLKSTYTDLSTSITLIQNAIHLTVTPASIPSGITGPQSTTDFYSFDFKSSNTPTGTYDFNVNIYSGENLAFSELHTIWVEK